MTQLLLEGEVDQTQAFVTALNKLKERIDELEHELDMAKLETEQAKQQAARSGAKLKKLVAPWLTALKAVSGELDEFADEETAEAPKTNARLESWKQKLPGRPAEMIDLLVLHGPMSTKNLMAAMHCAKDTVYQAAYKLGNAGVISNSNGKYSLKEN